MTHLSFDLWTFSHILLSAMYLRLCVRSLQQIETDGQPPYKYTDTGSRRKPCRGACQDQVV